MNILILSTSNNDHAAKVETILVTKGCEIIRFNTDELCVDQPLLSISNPLDQVIIQNTFGHIPLDEIHGIFVHHPIIETPNEYGVDNLDNSLHKGSWVNAIDCLEESILKSVWVNKPSISRKIASVIYQIKTAKQNGFKTPDTLFTNSICDLKEFSVIHPKIIIKPGNLSGLKTKGRRMLGRLIDLPSLDTTTLVNAPCLFQEYIEKDYEIRVHVVGQHVFACKIDSQKSEKTKIDWRNYDLRNTPHKPIVLEDSVAKKCCRVVQNMNLQMGIIDLIKTPNGEVIFLECNSQGHWIWIEELTGLPITEQVCRLLIGSD